MASAKDRRKKIRSIANTKKITRTMELVATAKSKRAQGRITATTPYSRALSEILESLSGEGAVKHPLLESPRSDRLALFVVTANRGLCGGYNGNVLSLAERTLREEEAAGRKVDVYLAGRKGIARFRFLKRPVHQSFLNLDDKATFADLEKVADGILGRFLAGELSRVLVAYTKYFSAGVQKPVLVQLLPVVRPETGDGKAAAPAGGQAGMVDSLFEADPRTIPQAPLP